MDFNMYVPTKILFGAGTLNELGKQQLPGKKAVIIISNGKSTRANGYLSRTEEQLAHAGVTTSVFDKIQPNPLKETVMEGAAFVKAQGADFIVALGGGSVIDSAKAIGYGLTNEGDVWDYYTGKAPQACMPIGAVLTIAAAGSEMSNASIITNENGWLKRGAYSPYAYCKFAVMNPELTYTLPAYQTASGCTDIIVHSLERFFTKPDVKQLNLTDGIAETLIKNVMRNVKAALKKTDDYDARAEIMWSGTLSHNDITGDRTLGDWACHQLEHELGGMFDIAHGAGLAAVWGSWARYVMPVNPARFAQLAVNVFGIPYTAGAEEKIALEGIEAMEAFFKSIGMPTRISDMDIHLTDEQIKELAYKCSFNNTRTIGGFKALNIDDMEKIYQMAK